MKEKLTILILRVRIAIIKLENKFLRWFYKIEE